MSTALILAGHGSHISPETAGLVWGFVDALRLKSIADEITAAFWKEMPSFHTVFSTLASDNITVVPLFTARGYFTQTVIPAEMELNDKLTRRGNKIIHYTRTLNEHPYIAQIVRQRVEEGLRALNARPENTAVAIIGHSTRRNPESRRATEAQADDVRASGLVAEVQAVYLDDSPEIATIYELTSAPNLIAVPYFLALGSHATIDVPKELSLAPGRVTGQVKGRTVYYTPPIGTDNALLKVIIELAEEALTLNLSHSERDSSEHDLCHLPFLPEGEGLGMRAKTDTNNSAWQHFPISRRDLFIETVLRLGAMHFGQLRVTPNVIHVWDDEHPDEPLETPTVLRKRVREQPFRPLATSTDLPGGWHVKIESPEMIHAVVETVYPGAIADWVAHQNGELVFNSLEATAARQTGMYRRLDELSQEKRSALVEGICGSCVRHPTWFFGQTPLNTLPCPEPCNFWMSHALEGR